MINNETPMDMEDGTTLFIRNQDGYEEERSSEVLKKLKASVMLIGVILGVALESSSWAARLALMKLFQLESMWLDLLCTLTCIFVIPTIVMELIRIAVRAAAELASSKRIDDAVFCRLVLHIQSRFGAGVLCGVLMALPVLDFSLELRHHFRAAIEVAGVLILWCGLLEKRLLDEATTIRLASRLKEEEDEKYDPTISVF